jgi:phospholipase C
MKQGFLASVFAAAVCWTGQASAQTADDAAVPRYAHIVVILEENKDYAQVLDPAVAPHIAGWMKRYGTATRFYGEVHPSEANYVALLGGDTFGIHDDDAFYCKPGQIDPSCPHALQTGYTDHTAHAPSLGDQLLRAGLSWKAYLEDLPEPGSLAVNAGAGAPGAPLTIATALYASKHSGFVNFESVQTDPNRAMRLVDFKSLDADLAANALPAFALIVPNQCNEMHGLFGPNMPEGCSITQTLPLIRRGDAELGRLVGAIQATPAWRSKENVAIVITFDEGSGGDRQGCCSVTPTAPSNYGGGHIPTVVITNHGPRGVADDTPYNHYSLLRTMEDAFGLSEHLGRAADTAGGVVPMTKLFAVRKPSPLCALLPPLCPTP